MHRSMLYQTLRGCNKYLELFVKITSHICLRIIIYFIHDTFINYKHKKKKEEQKEEEN